MSFSCAAIPNLRTEGAACSTTELFALPGQGLLALAALFAGFVPEASSAATVSWNTDASGSWHTASNWSGGVLPGNLSDVVIDRGVANPLITYSTGATAINSLSSFEPFRLSGGELTLNGASTINGAFTFTSAGIQGRLIVNDALTVNGALHWTQVAEFGGPGITTLAGTTTASFGTIGAGHRIVNRGTTTFSNTIGFGSGAIFENHSAGTLLLSDQFENGLSGNILVEPAVYNSGTLRKDSGSGRTYLSALHNSGLVRVQQGVLAFGSGTSIGRFEVATGATLSISGKHFLSTASVVDAPTGDVWINFPTITGSGGQFAGSFSAARLTVYNGSFDTPNVTFVGPSPNIRALILKQSGHVNISSTSAVTLESLDLGTYPEIPGVLSGTAIINVTGVIAGDGGWMRGIGTTNALGGIAAHFGLRDGRVLNNSGAAHGHVGLSHGAVVNNLPGATWTMVNGFDSDLSSRFNNQGLVRWNVPTSQHGDSPLGMFGGSLYNSGTLEVHAGRVVWGAGESVNTGTIRLFDGVKFEISSGNFRHEGNGIFQGASADLKVGESYPTTFLVNGRLSVRDVTFSHGEMSFLGNSPKALRTLTTHFHSTGVVKIDGSGTTVGQLVATGGEVQIRGGMNVVEHMEIYGRGIVSIMTGGSFSPAAAFALTETGTLWIHAGSAFSMPGSASVSQTSGLMIVDGRLVAPSAAFMGSSRLGGHGTVDGNVRIGGTLHPGAMPSIGVRPGRLTIAGDLDVEPGAHFIVHLGGPSSSGEFDSLLVGGEALIDGSLQIQVASGFVPHVGDRFIVLTAASRSGTFTAISGGEISDDLRLVPVWEGSNLILVAVPEPSSYLLMLVGGGCVAFGIRRRKRRSAGRPRAAYRH